MFKKRTESSNSRKTFWGVSKWNLLYLVLALLLLFSLVAVPRIVIGAMNETKGQVITVPSE